MAILKGVTMTNLGPKVDIAEVFAQDVTYATLAAAFHVNAYDILVELCKAKGTNEKAFADIYRVFLSQRPWLTSFTDRRRQAEQFWAEAHGGTAQLGKHNLPFLNWSIPEAVVIRLPASARSALLISADAAEASRYIQVAIKCPEISKLEIIAGEIEAIADSLDKHLAELERQFSERVHESLVYLVSAERLLAMMYGSIPNTPESIVHHHYHDHVELLDELRAVIEGATVLMGTKPQLFDWYLHAQIDDDVKALIAILEDPDNVQYLTDLVQYYDVAEQRVIWARFEAALLHASKAIVRTKHVDDFVERHLIPFLAGMAEAADVDKLADRVRGTPLHGALLDDWRGAVPQVKSKGTLLRVMGTIGSVGAGAVGNSRGPASLAVALVTCAGPVCAKFLAARSLALKDSGTLATAVCLRVLMRVADLSAKIDLDNLVAGLLPDKPTRVSLARIDDIDWSTKLMSGSLWAGVYALANLAALLSLVTSDDDLTIERLGQTILSASQTAVPLAEIGNAILGKYGTAQGARSALRVAQHTAIYAGVLSLLLAGWTIMKEIHELADENSIDPLDVFNIVGSAATATAVGGWLFASSMSAAAATGFMFFGSLISVAMTIAAIGYESATRGPGTATYIRACLEAFKASEAGSKALTDKAFNKSFAELEQHLDKIKHHLVSFAGKQDELWTLVTHFSPEACATIIEMKPDIVREILGLD